MTCRPFVGFATLYTRNNNACIYKRKNNTPPVMHEHKRAMDPPTHPDTS